MVVSDLICRRESSPTSGGVILVGDDVSLGQLEIERTFSESFHKFQGFPSQ